jgi:hypothetical protein
MDFDKIEREILELAATASDRTDFWSAFIRNRGLQTLAEVGVYKGEFAERILRDCPDIRHYHMIDPWRKLADWNKPANKSDSEFKEIYEEAVRRTAFASDKIEIHRDRTLDCHKRIDNCSLDFLYIDGDHTLKGITADLLLMFEKVKVGGVLGGDDFSKTIWQHDEQFDPTFVCPFAIYFAEAMGVPIFCLPHQQFLILKKREIGFKLIDLDGGYEELRIGDMLATRKQRRGNCFARLAGKIKRLFARS